MPGIGTRGQHAVQHVIAIGGDHQIVDRQAHAVRQVPRVNVAEVAGGYREIDRPIGPTQRESGIKVVDNLGHYARPVDRVDGDQRASIREECVSDKARFHQRLTVVEVTPNGKVMNIVSRHSGHLATLHVGDPAIGIENKNIHVLAMPASLDRRTPSITRGGAHDDNLLAASGQYVVEQAPQQLQRKVFERQRGPVEQFEQPLVVIQLQDRGNGLMPEVAI